MRKNISKILFIILIVGLIATLLACSNSNNKKQNTDLDDVYVVQIDIDNSSIPSTAYVGEFNVSSISLDVLYSDGNKETIPLKEEYISVNKRNKLKMAGTYSIDVIYKNCKDSFTITLLDKNKSQYSLNIYGGIPISVNDEEVYYPNTEHFIGTFNDDDIITIKWIAEEGKTFSYWTCNDEIIDTQSTTTFHLIENLTYRSFSTNNVYTVTFVTFNENITVAQKKTTSINNINDISTHMVMEEYVFIGWTLENLTQVEALSGDSSITLVSFPYIVDKDVTFNAVWSPLGLAYTNYIDTVNNVEGYQVVGYNGSLTELDIPSSHNNRPVLSIARDSFDSTNSKYLTTIHIPNTVVDIEEGAFKNCSSLKSFTVDSSSMHYATESNVLYKDDYEILVAYPQNKVANTYTLNDNVIKISEYAFYNAVLGSININESLQNIGNHAFDTIHLDHIDFSQLLPTKLNSIGDYVFNIYLENVYVSPTHLTAYSSIFSNITSKLCTASNELNTLGVYNYKDDYKILYKLITNENFENSNVSVELIGSSRDITEFVIPNSIVVNNINRIVTSIGFYCFQDCNLLRNIVLPEYLERVCDYAFNDTIWYENLPNNSIIANNVLYKYLGNLGEYKLDSNIVKIAEGAFSNNHNIEFIDISSNSNLTNIAAYAFYNCIYLTNFANSNSGSTLFIKENLVEIGAYAFSNTRIVNINTQSNSGALTTIKDYAFSSNKYLIHINLTNNSLSNIADTAFLNSNSIVEVNVSIDNTHFTSINGILYETDSTNTYLKYYPSGKMLPIFSPNDPDDNGIENFSVSRINNYSLYHSNIGALVINSSISSIATNAIYLDSTVYIEFKDAPTTGITYNANFINTNVEKIVFSPSVNESIINTFFNSNTVLKNNLYTTSIPYTFTTEYSDIVIAKSSAKNIIVLSNKTIPSIEIPSSITLDNLYIGGYAFSGSYLEDITINCNVAEMSKYAFSTAENLYSLTLANTNVNYIPVVYSETFGELLNSLFIYVNIDPEISNSYIDKWGSLFVVNEYDSVDGMNTHRQITNIINTTPTIVITYEDSTNNLHTASIINGTTISNSIFTEQMYNDINSSYTGFEIENWVILTDLLDDDYSDNLFVSDLYSYTFDYNTILRAIWTTKTYRVYFTISDTMSINFEAEQVEMSGQNYYCVELQYNDKYTFTITDSASYIYDFDGWNCALDSINIDPAGIWAYAFSSEDVYLTAITTKHPYTIIYDTTNCTMGTSSKTVYYNEPYTLEIPTRTGYEFKSWSVRINDNDTILTNASGISINNWSYYKSETYTVYANWEANTINVNFYLDSALNNLFKSTTIKYDSNNDLVDEYITFTNTDYNNRIFAGWTDEDGVFYFDYLGFSLRVWDKTTTTNLVAVWATEITSGAGLISAINSDPNVSVILKNDISIDSCINVEFSGYLMGDNYAININQSSTNGLIGLFATNSGTIQDVKFNISVDISLTDTNTHTIGLICGTNNGTIRNISIEINSCNISISSTCTNNIKIGGITAINNGEIIDITTCKIKNFKVLYDDTPYENQINYINVGLIFAENSIDSIIDNMNIFYTHNKYTYGASIIYNDDYYINAYANNNIGTITNTKVIKAN